MKLPGKARPIPAPTVTVEIEEEAPRTGMEPPAMETAGSTGAIPGYTTGEQRCGYCQHFDGATCTQFNSAAEFDGHCPEFAGEAGEESEAAPAEDG